MASPARDALTADVIVDAAVRLVEEFDLDALTMRRLAAELAIELPELSGFSITVSDDRGEIIGRALISSPPKAVLQ